MTRASRKLCGNSDVKKTRRILVSEILLTVLSETLNGLAEEQRETQAALERYQEEVRLAQEEMKIAVERAACTADEHEQVLRKIEALKTYISGLREHPHVLRDKMSKLEGEEEWTAQAHREAVGQIADVESTLQSKQQQIWEAEQRYEKLQEQRNEVSEHISNVQRSL
jgi:chromosome segregation ATPase